MDKETKNFLLKSLLVAVIVILINCFWSLLESLGFRYRVRFPFLFNMGSFLGVMLLFYIYARKKIAKTQLSSVKSKLSEHMLLGFFSFFCFFTFFLVMYFGDAVSMSQNALFYGMLLHIQYIIGFIFLFLAVFGIGFFRHFYKELLITFFVLFDFIIIAIIITSNWRFFAESLVKLVYLFQSLFTRDTSYYFAENIPRLSLKGFSVTVGASCSGIESLSMFILVAIFVLMLDYDKINFKRAWILLPGLLGMYSMSVVRIAVLMWVGTFNPALSLGLFHTNTGWILFAVYLLVFWGIAYPWLTAKKEAKKHQHHAKH